MLKVLAPVAALHLFAIACAAADVPAPPPGAKAVVVVVAAIEGGSSDLVARAFASALKEELRVPVSVRNLPGNGGTDGIAAIVQPSDELRVGIVNNTGLVPGLLLRQGKFDASSLEWVGVVGTYPNAIVTARAGSPPLGEWLKRQRQGGTPQRYGANVPGAINYLALMFLQSTGVPVEYRELPQLEVAYRMLRNGQLDYLLDGTPSALASGLPIIGLATQARVPDLPLQAWGEYLPSPPFEVLTAIAVGARESPELKEWVKAAWNAIRTRESFATEIRSLGVRYRGVDPAESASFVENAFLEHAVLLGRYLPGGKGTTEPDRADGRAPAPAPRPAIPPP
jgi:tripartite-type tricarboxylate transporter receptor subunit TctC